GWRLGVHKRMPIGRNDLGLQMEALELRQQPFGRLLHIAVVFAVRRDARDFQQVDQLGFEPGFMFIQIVINPRHRRLFAPPLPQLRYFCGATRTFTLARKAYNIGLCPTAPRVGRRYASTVTLARWKGIKSGRRTPGRSGGASRPPQAKCEEKAKRSPAP